MTFVKSVGAGQTVLDNGTLNIADPKNFLATVDLSSTPTHPTTVPSLIDLAGLASADSYTYQNDMLSIFGGGKVIDTLKLHDNTAYGFEVTKVGGDVHVAALTSPKSDTTRRPDSCGELTFGGQPRIREDKQRMAKSEKATVEIDLIPVIWDLGYVRTADVWRFVTAPASALDRAPHGDRSRTRPDAQPARLGSIERAVGRASVTAIAARKPAPSPTSLALPAPPGPLRARC